MYGTRSYEYEPYSPYDLPRRPLSPRQWMNRVLVHKGNAEALAVRFEHAVEHVEYGEMEKPILAESLFWIITDDRNFRNAFHSLCHKPRNSHEKAEWTRLKHRLFDLSKRIMMQLREGVYRRRKEYVRKESKPKGGFRDIVVQSPVDRVIDKKCAQILSVALDSTFLHSSWAYRPGRGCWHAIKRARALIRQGFTHWVSCDVSNAFGSVSVRRLLEVLQSRLPDNELNDLISERLSGSPVKGLRPGSPLSPLMLNLYMDHFLDRPWHLRHPNCPLIRYADDILIGCHSKREAGQCYRDLVVMLQPHGMKLNETQAQAVSDVRTSPLKYLGFHLSIQDGRTTARIATESFLKLQCTLEEACQKERDLSRSVLSWIHYFGPAFRWEDRGSVYRQAREQFTALGKADRMPGESVFVSVWKKARKRYADLSIT